MHEPPADPTQSLGPQSDLDLQCGGREYDYLPENHLNRYCIACCDAQPEAVPDSLSPWDAHWLGFQAPYFVLSVFEKSTKYGCGSFRKLDSRR